MQCVACGGFLHDSSICMIMPDDGSFCAGKVCTVCGMECAELAVKLVKRNLATAFLLSVSGFGLHAGLAKDIFYLAYPRLPKELPLLWGRWSGSQVMIDYSDGAKRRSTYGTCDLAVEEDGITFCELFDDSE